MAVLSDSDIVKRLRRGALGIEPFREEQLTPNGYDLSLAEIQLAGEPPLKEGRIEIGPGRWFAVATAERVRLPADLCGELWLRSTHIRRGLVTAFGRVDAGFEGNLTLTGYNAGASPVPLAVGERYCQLVFVELSSPAKKPYASRSGNYQGQRGITLESIGPGQEEGADKLARRDVKAGKGR